MLETVKQREYIQQFINFVGSFLISEQVTIDELNTVKANLDILDKRIASFGNCKVGGTGHIMAEKVSYPDFIVSGNG